MKLINLTDEQFSNFAINHQKRNFHQTIEWANLKNITGWKKHIVGLVNEENQIQAATLILEKNTPIKRPLFYAPRGFLIDFKDKDLLTTFTEELIKYANKHKAFLIKVDPDIMYQERDIDGNLIEGGINNHEIVENLINLGYKHLGFSINFESLQPRWIFRLKLNEDYQSIFNKFTKNTKRNIKIAQNKGLEIIHGGYDDLKVFTEIHDLTGDRRGFITRPLSYYQQMYTSLEKYVHVYIARINPNKYLTNTQQLLDDELKNNQEIIRKMEIEKVGNKLINAKATSDKLITKYESEIKEALQLSQEHPEGINVGTLLTIGYGDDYLALLSGMDNQYRSFNPKYALYDEHIKDGIKYGFKYSNFYGIPGNLSKDNPDYGIYEFKKGFDGEVCEYIGEFDLITNKVIYRLYKLALKAYALKKKLRK